MSRKKNNNNNTLKPTLNGRVKDSVRINRASDVVREQLERLNLSNRRLVPDKELDEMTLFEKNVAYLAEEIHVEMVDLMLRLKVLGGFCAMREDGFEPDEETLPPDPYDDLTPDPLQWIIDNSDLWEGYEEEIFPLKEIEGSAKISKDGKIFFEPDNG